MATQTTYYELNKPGSSDLVNPLTDTFPNWDIIDQAMHDNHILGVTTATEIVTTGVHALTRADEDLPFFRFVATANFNEGDTFTLDGVSVTAYNTAGQSLSDDDFVANAVVLGCYNSVNSTITLFVSKTQTTVANADNSDKLGNELPSYYATAGDIANINANKLDSVAVAPAYNSNTTYSIGNSVTYQGKRYICNTNMLQAEAWDPTHWDLTSIDNTISSLKSDLDDKADVSNVSISLPGVTNRFTRANLIDKSLNISSHLSGIYTSQNETATIGTVTGATSTVAQAIIGYNLSSNSFCLLFLENTSIKIFSPVGINSTDELYLNGVFVID